MKYSIYVMVLAFCSSLSAQSVGIGNTSPNPNALLEIGESPGEQGLLLPRLKSGTITTLAGSYGGTEQGMLVYDADNDLVRTWDGTQWNTLGDGTDSYWSELGASIFNTTSRIGIGVNFPTAKVQINGGTSDTALYVVGTGNFTAVFEGSDVVIEKNVGIGILSPDQALDVNGNIEFTDALMPNGNPGTAGQYLISDGANNPPKWITKPTEIFQLILTPSSGGVDIQPIGGGFKPIPYDAEDVNVGSGTFPSNGEYRVAFDALYEFDAGITCLPDGTNKIESVFIRIVNKTTGEVLAENVGQCSELDNHACTVSISAKLVVAAGDVIYVDAATSNNQRDIMMTTTYPGGTFVSWFNGSLLQLK